MKVLICGSYDVFSLSMISKLKKENHEIFVLTGKSQQTLNKPKEVFQEYDFPFTSPSVEFIMSNVMPDVVVYLGAFDSGFEWKKESQDAVNYAAGLLNVLLTAKAAGIRKVVYLSSYEVFEGNGGDVISEDVHAIPVSLRAKTFLQGEKACRMHHEKDAFEVDVIRLGEVYGNYKNQLLKSNIVYQLLVGDYSAMDWNQEYHLLYIDDAQEGIYRVMTTKTQEHTLYHIGDEESTTSGEVLIALKSYVDADVVAEASKQMSKKSSQTVLASSIKYLGYSPKYTLSSAMPKMDAAIKGRKTTEAKHESMAAKEDKKKKNQFLPYIETIALFILLQIFLYITRGSAFHETVDLYLWFVVVIVSVHGLTQGKLAIVLSIFGKFTIDVIGGVNSSVIYDYHSYLWVLQIIVIGMLAGYGRDKFKRIVEDLTDENHYLQKEFDNIKSINTSNVMAKNIYERHLVNHSNSMGRIYDIIAQMDSLEPQSIVFEAIDVVSQLMNTKDVAIYSCDANSDYCRLIASSSEKAKRMGKSIQLKNTKEFAENLKEGKVYRNLGLNEEYPLIAGGAFDDGKMKMVIMIWSMDVKDINLNQVNIFSIICKLMERSLARAYDYMETTHEASYIIHTKVMTETAFQKVLDLYNFGKKRKMLEYTLLKVAKDADNAQEQYKKLGKLTRETDYIGLYGQNSILILLTNTNEMDAENVMSRFMESGVTVEIVNQ